MFENEDNERGQVGIGTLIVFIALILVAAVAAAVLVETAGFLQGDAEATSEDARDEVSDQINVVTASGETASSANAVEYANLTVKKSAGSADLNLTAATVQYTSDDTAATLVHNSSLGGEDFTTADIDGTTSGEVLTETSDRAEVRLDLSAIEGDSGLGEGESATLEIVDQSGASTVKVINVPPTIGDDEVVRLG